MLAVAGVFQNGYVTLDQDYPSDRPVKVIVTFLEALEPSSDRGLSLTDFSFSKSRQALAGYQGSFGDAVVEERRTTS